MNPFGVNVSVIYSSLDNPFKFNIHLETLFQKTFILYFYVLELAGKPFWIIFFSSA